MIKFNCYHCNESIKAVDEITGESSKCPACKKHLHIPHLPNANPRLPRKIKPYSSKRAKFFLYALHIAVLISLLLLFLSNEIFYLVAGILAYVGLNKYFQDQVENDYKYIKRDNFECDIKEDYARRNYISVKDIDVWLVPELERKMDRYDQRNNT